MEIDRILELYADKIKEIDYELISLKDGKLHFYNNKKEKEITIDSNNVYSIKRLTKEEQNVFFNIFEESTETVKKITCKEDKQ